MKQSSKYNDEKKIHELENVKLKLKMISKNSKSSKVSVDDYISNILGSGLTISKSNTNKTESQSAQSLHHDKPTKSNGNEYNHSSVNVSSLPFAESMIDTDFYLNLPYVYQEVINKVKLSTGELDTQQIYMVFTSSGLSMEILGSVWSMINRTLPGKLTILELSVGLAMLALYQKQSVTSRNMHSFSPITWDYVLSRGEFLIPQLSLDKAANLSNGMDLSNICPINQNIRPTSFSKENSTDNENWADFSSFVSQDHELSANVTTINNKADVNFHSINELKSENQSLDIQKQINNQFSSWQNNITLEGALTNVSADHSQTVNIVDSTPSDVAALNNKSSVEIGKPKKSVVDSDFGDFQNFSTNYSMIPNYSDSGLSNKTPITDRYQIFNSEIQDPHNNLIDQWLRCLIQCEKIIFDTAKVLNPITEDSIKIEVFNSEKGVLLIRGIIEVYRVTRNIKLSTSKTKIIPSSKSLIDVFTNIEKYWNDFMLLLPDEMQIDVQTKLSKGNLNCNDNLQSDDATLTDCCGVCLCVLDPDDGFLSHGLRRYHCPCANLWVNTLDLTLPGLRIPGPVL